MKIYKKDSKGEIRVLEIYAEKNQVVQKFGLLDGKQTISFSNCVGKNIGKSNETTPEKQAIAEMEAKIIKKLEKEYFKTIEETESSEVLLPMLAKDYKKESHKVDWTKAVYVQPKLDGMRALGSKGTLTSRQGKDIDTVPHIKDMLATLNKENIDGELYTHGLTFQENMKLVKKYRAGETEQIKYCVYDMVSDKPFFERYQDLCSIVASYGAVVHTVYTKQVYSEAEVKKAHAMFLSEGYEGTIIRHGNNGYKIKGRSSNLLKYKDFIDEVFEIIDVVSSEKCPEQGLFECKTKTGQVFRTGMKMSHEERAEVLVNKKKYIGKKAEIRFFEWTDGGLPRFPQCVGVRLDK